MKIRGAIRRIVWRWLEPEAHAWATDRQIDFYDGLMERKQICPPVIKPVIPVSGPGISRLAGDGMPQPSPVVHALGHLNLSVLCARIRGMLGVFPLPPSTR